jgi:hydrogenase maturation protein HypF
MIRAVDGIREGMIVVFKGLGGFQLMVSAGNDDAVARLRMRKQREEKPLALMFPSLEMIERCCRVSMPERFLLESSAAPIVLLERKAAFRDKIHIAASVAPGNPCYGVMLPYTPMHHILMKEFGAPLVATSGNLTDEPICIDEKEALHRLRGVADLFLIHNRPVIRYVDDSVVRIIMDRPMMLRRARGYAPLPVESPEVLPPILGVGGHLKNTVAFSVEKNIIVSQHIGDLETKLSVDAFRQAVDTFRKLYDSSPTLVACDMHPDYSSTRFARQTAIPLISVQHHHAHILACMAENDIWSNVLGVAWDGTGFGIDGSIWGGEFLLSTISGFNRIGHFRTFRLPGGDKAVKEPRRTALGVLYEVFGEEAFNLSDLPCLKAFNYRELNIIRQMLTRGLNAPLTSSAGRLFDAVASLIGLHQTISFEGQAAMFLESVIDGTTPSIQYSYEIVSKKTGQTVLSVIDWSPMIKEIIQDVRGGIPAGRIAKKFHNTLIEIVIAMSKRTREKSVVLSGGCFQNKFLTEGVVKGLREEGFNPYWHQRIPPNDGGIAIGQVVLASHCLKESG